MKPKTLLSALLLILYLPIFAQGKSATLIVHHAVIHTLDDKNTIVEAMAVADGKILKTGTNNEILKLKNKKTTIIDAKGKVIIPGIFDSHMHIIRGGRFFNTELRWDGVRSLKKLWPC